MAAECTIRIPEHNLGSGKKMGNSYYSIMMHDLQESILYLKLLFI